MSGTCPVAYPIYANIQNPQFKASVDRDGKVSLVSSAHQSSCDFWTETQKSDSLYSPIGYRFFWFCNFDGTNYKVYDTHGIEGLGDLL